MLRRFRLFGRPTDRTGPRRRRTAVAVLALLGSLGATGVVTAPPASAAATAVASGIQLRGVAGNCLTADALGSLAWITMRTCGSTPASRQTWDIVEWDAAFGSARSLRLNELPGLCLGLAANSTTAESRTVLQTCDPMTNPSILWDRFDLQTGAGDIHNIRSGLCLDVKFVGTAQGTPVWQWYCNSDSDAQTWLLGRTDYAGQVVGHGLNCLSARAALPGNGSTAVMRTCDGFAAQRWAMVDGYLMVGGKCLEVRGGNPASGTDVVVSTCVNDPRQRWVQRPSGVLESRLGGVCLDVQYGATTDGTAVWSYACNQTYAQGWWFGSPPDRLVDTQALATRLNAHVAARTGSCQGMVFYQVDNIRIVAMKNPAPLVVRRATGALFTAAAQSTGLFQWPNRAAVNGGFFDVVGANAFKVQGDIYANGAPVATDPYRDVREHFQGFYVTAPSMGCGSQWSIGPQDPATRPLGQQPPEGSVFAMGGARPLIINGSRWGTAQSGYLQWPESAGKQFGDYEPAINGKTTVGVRGDGIVMLMVQENLTNGKRLSQIRDAYALLGFNDAVLFDSNSSSTLAVNGIVRAAPDLDKNRVIPFGLGMATGN